MTALMPEANVDDLALPGADSAEFSRELDRALAELGDEAQPEPSADQRASAAMAEDPAAVEPASDPTTSQPVEATSEAAPSDPPKAEEAKPAEQPEQPAAEDKRSKYAKEAERRDRSWKALNEQKAAHEAEFAKFKAEQEAFARQQAEFTERVQKERTPDYTPEQCEAAAKAHEAAGKFDLADLLRAEAKRLRENPRPKVNPAGPRALSEAAKQSLTRVRTEFPEFTHKDSPHFKAFSQLAQERPDLMHIPDGPYLAAQHIRLATEHATLKQAASRVPSLEKQVAELQAKLKEQESLLSISGGAGPAAMPTGQRGFDDLSEEEMRAAVLADFRR